MQVRRTLLPAVLAIFAVAAPAAGQLPGLPQGLEEADVPAPVPAAAEGAEQDSPRQNLTEFLELSRAGQHTEASRYLEVPADLAGRGPELARKLKLVLDRKLWIDLEKVSPLPDGRRDDGLPAELEEIGVLPVAPGRSEPVMLIRKARLESPRWVFSRDTVTRVPAWYGALDNRRLLERIPAPLMRPGPKDLLWWQWIAVLVLLLPAWWGGRTLGWVTGKALHRVAARTASTWDDALLLRMRGPLALGWMLFILRVGLPALDLYAPAEAFMIQLLKAGAVVAVFWATLRAIIVAGDVLAEAPWATSNPAARSFLHFSVRFGRVFVVGIGILVALSALHVPVNSVLAGLGIGGIAIAFAAQKTVENFFGAISLGVDQPLRVGDFVKVDATLGVVESIGLRSTRLRTLDRTLVSIPNGKLADMQIETFAVRDRIRLAVVVGLEYGTTSAQMREVVAGIEGHLRAHPKIWPETVVVRFIGFADSSLSVEVMAWFQTTDFAEFRDIRQEVLLGIMEIVEKNGCSFAFPTRTVHLAGSGTPPLPPAS